MADVTLSYKGSDILELSDSGSATLKTGGKYCEDDIAVEYVKPSGGGGRNKIYGQYVLSGNSDTPTQLDIEVLTSSKQQFEVVYTNMGSRTLSIDIKSDYQSVLLGTMNVGNAAGGGALKEITCRESPNLQVKLEVSSQMFRGQLRLEKIEPAINLSNITTDWSRTWDNASGSVLSYVRIVPNTAKAGIRFDVCSMLSDESLVSIANGLTAVSKTFTLHATPKAKLSTIMGTVSQVTDDTGTYDFFTADANGTVTLMNFITNTKGWTVA